MLEEVVLRYFIDRFWDWESTQYLDGKQQLFTFGSGHTIRKICQLCLAEWRHSVERNLLEMMLQEKILVLSEMSTHFY